MNREKYIDEVPAYQREVKCEKCGRKFFKKFEAHNICEDCEEIMITEINAALAEERALEAMEEEWRQEKYEQLSCEN